jgi:hypothetical protein
VCFAAAEGGAFAQVQQDVQALLNADQGTPVEISRETRGVVSPAVWAVGAAIRWGSGA